MKHVFVLGMTDLQREELETVRRADEYEFHGLLDYERLVLDDEPDFEQLLDEARAELSAYDGPVDAIITHWDFPTSLLGPILASERGIPAPSLESLVKCEHKYWSRLEQKASVPECVPAFSAFDPFADDPLSQVEVPFPFWVKPVKSHSSQLGFEIHDEQQFREAVEEIRGAIEAVGDAFNAVLKRLDLPEELQGAGGNTCLAEGLVTGIQAAPEGTMSDGHFQVHGLLDMHKDEAGTSFERFDYPAATVPAEVQERMVDISERYLRRVGFDNGCFNSEFLWDEQQDRIWMIEVNTRISQSHSDLFVKVDGASNHEVAIDVALGERPEMPHREGRFKVAAKCMILRDEDAVVTRVPTPEELAKVKEDFEDTVVSLHCEEGDRLSETPHQDSYRYIIGDAYVGANSREELQEKFDAVVEALDFRFAPVDDEGAA